MNDTRTRILFCSEAVTLSQVVRLVTLARALDETRYRVTFACADFDERVFGGTRFARRRVHSLEPSALLGALRHGRRLYDTRTLHAQADEDRRVFDEVEPDLVVGDFRWSLAVSAPLAGVRHAALINAYFSPHAARSAFPVPDHPIVQVLGERLTARYFPVALPHVFAHFAEPLNQVRAAHGLSPVGSLLEVLTHADHTLYADPEALVPTPTAPPSHEHLGFVPWAPEGALPREIAALPPEAPVVYATLGSSGSVDVLPIVVEALGNLPVTALVATAGRRSPVEVPRNVHVVDFAPGDLAARRASAVISNGGSSTSYQALAEGTPVLGLASNLDQYLAMQAVERESAGLLVRARSATVPSVLLALRTLLGSAAHREGARRVQGMLRGAPAVDRFRRFVARVTGATRERPAARGPAAALLATLAFLVASLPGLPARAEPPPASDPRGEIRFDIKVDGRGGHVICALFRADGWLEKPVATVKSKLRSRRATCVFSSVKPGMYAIVAFHDENDNGDIDKNFLGIPTESWCTSRNARAIFGPPSFGAAKFLSRGNILRLGGTM